MSEPTQDPQHEERQLLREKYQKALGMVWRLPDNCPVCDSTFWNIGDLVDVALRNLPIVTPLAWRGDFPHRAYVYAPVTCLYCGYTLFFHTGVLDTRLTEEVPAVPPLRAPGETP